MGIPEIYKHYLEHPEISTDSRKIIPGCIFFALRGPTFNGNKFADKALQMGASLCIIDEAEYSVNHNCIVVTDVLATLQALARYHREQFHFPVLGITGSNGKTTTKELISAVLKKKYNIVFTEGNLNNHIGVPLTLLQINDSTEFAVIEMGANAPGEIAMLCEIARPDLALITSIGKAHLAGFGTIDVITHTKKALYDFIRDHKGKAFVNGDNPLLRELSATCDCIIYGSGEDAVYPARRLQSSPFVHLSFFSGEREYTIKSQLTGAYNFANLQSAIAVGLEYGVDAQDIVAALENYQAVNNRSQLVRTGRNFLIQDAYNANPTSMTAALESFIQMEGEPKAVILGDMLELGSFEDEEHQEILHWLELHPHIKVFLAGPVFSRLNNNENFIAMKDSASLRDYLFQYPLRSYTILIKGSRGIAVEKVVDAL